MNASICHVDDCTAPVIAKGYCVKHYKRFRRYGDPMIRMRVQRHESDQCQHPDGCPRKVKANGWCRMHWDRIKTFGDAGPAGLFSVRGKHSLAPGKTTNKDGYVLLWDREAKRYHMEHRLVVESSLGRTLDPEESIHHINGDRRDNGLENLEIWATWHGKGQRVVDLVARVVELYPDLVVAAQIARGR